MAFSIIAARLRAERRAALRGSAVTLSQPSVGEFAHQGHRTDLPDERLVSHREPRWIDGHRYVWEDGMWVRQAELFDKVGPPREAPQTHIVLGPKQRPHVKPILQRVIDQVIEAGGRPEDIEIIVGRRLK